MSLYTLKHLLHDCSERHVGRVDKNEKVKKLETLQNVWNALNDWIESRLYIAKGVHIATFATITWETYSTNTNQSKLRPLCLFSDTFLKTYNLSQMNPSIQAPTLAPQEDINFTKIAIKFSKVLTKDIVFTSIRDIVQKLGEVCSTGSPVSIAFRFGKVVGKNRCLSMIFDTIKLPTSIKSQVIVSRIGSPHGGLGDISAFDISIPPFMTQAKSLEDQQRQDLYQDDDNLPSPLPTTRQNPKCLLLEPVGIENQLEMIGISKFGSPSKNGNPPVVESAYRRHVASLVNDIDLEAKYAHDTKLQQKRELDTLDFECHLKKTCAVDLQRSLIQQIQDTKNRKSMEKKELLAVHPSASSVYTDSELMRLGYEDQAYIQKNKDNLRVSLVDQIQTNQKKRLESKEKSLDDEHEFLTRLRQEQANIDKQAQEYKHRVRQTLTESWKRDEALKKMVDDRKREKFNSSFIEISPRPQSPHYFPQLQELCLQHCNDGSKENCLNSQIKSPLKEQESTSEMDYSVGYDIRSARG